MSQQLINHSPDLKRLRDEGYDVRIISPHVVVGDVPYVNSAREVKRGMLISELTLALDTTTTTPGSHVIHFAGESPCDKDGQPLSKIILNHDATELGPGLLKQHSFSSKPPGGYPNYYLKFKTYISILSTPAQVIDPSATATTFRPIPTDEKESVFEYFDSASSRSEIGAMSARLELPRIAIIGLGGTGAYVLDFVSKTQVREIHLFDGDRVLQHNLFRYPGAFSLAELDGNPFKVDFLKEHYSKLHRFIIPHSVNVDESNVHSLKDMAFVFICIDKSASKRVIFRTLEEAGIPFVDTGMGISIENGALTGLVRTTTATTQKHDHLSKCVSFGDFEQEDLYAKNIQIADLNALNATFAVLKWKKHFCFYHDLEKEHHSLYSINGNHLSNSEQV